MSAIAEAFAPLDARYREAVMRDTWGHLAPTKNKKYPGYILFCHASDGYLCPIDYDFIGLPGSPWLHDAVIDFISDNTPEQCVIYRFDGSFKNYKFTGTIKKVNCQPDPT
jgi:hypothetical protein